MKTARCSPVRSLHAALVAALLITFATDTALGQWPQWGGPNRDFHADTGKLADKWPEDGPPRLWRRELGDSYATILVDEGMLYTMYRSGEKEFAVALDAKTGKTIWEHGNASPFTKVMAEYGAGPHSTPLILGNSVFTMGTNSVLHCRDKKSGNVKWKHDLVSEFDAVITQRGYSSSLIAYKNTIIVPLGRKTDEEKQQQQSLVAFRAGDGSVAWDNRDFETTEYDNTYSSPILINFQGQDQLVLFMCKELAGIDPSNGRRLWGLPHSTSYDENVSTPLFNGKDLLFMSSAYSGGSRGARLTRDGSRTVARELWYTRKMRVLFGSVVAIGDYAYGSSGDFGPTLLVGINMKTGKIAWRKRGFKRATCVLADGKVIILDEDGQLALTTPTPDDLTIHSKCDIGASQAWATPTIAGTTLYVRDRKHIMAFELG